MKLNIYTELSGQSGRAHSAEVIENLKELDALFFGRKVNCLNLSVSNRIVDAVLVVFLLEKGINFFIQLQSDTQYIPNFCDLSVRVESGHDGPESMIYLDENPRYNHSRLSSQQQVIFKTSGSTGEPKFVCHDHSSLRNNAQAVVDRLRLSNHSRILVPVPINHMYGFGVGLLPGLLCGASIHLLERTNVIKLYECLRNFKPTHTLINPTLVKMLLTLKNEIKFGQFISAGDRLSPDFYVNFERHFGSLINLYGSTELGAVGMTPVDASLDDRSRGILAPLAGVVVSTESTKRQVTCLHPSGFNSYMSEEGEIVKSRRSDEFFETSDLGVGEKTGFRILGRVDSLIKRAGYLVALQEIESALERIFPETVEVIVVRSKKETLFGDTMTAVFEVNTESKLNVDDMRKKCLEVLQRHLVPDEILLYNTLPRFGNGKIDRKTFELNLNS